MMGPQTATDIVTGLTVTVVLVAGIDFGIAFLTRASDEATSDD